MKRLLAGLVVLVVLGMLPGAASATHLTATDGPPPFDFANGAHVDTLVATPFGTFPGLYWQKARTTSGTCPPTCFKLFVSNTPFGPVTVTGKSNCTNSVAVVGHDSLFKGVITTSNSLLMPVGSVIVARLYDGDAVSIPAAQQGPDMAGVFAAPASPPSLCSLLPVATTPTSGPVSVHQH